MRTNIPPSEKSRQITGEIHISLIFFYVGFLYVRR